MANLLLAALAVLSLATFSSANLNLTSNPVTNWGKWGAFERCPFGRYVQGFQLRTEGNQLLGDDTALNAIRLFCGDPYNPSTAVLTSSMGDFGSWGNVFSCSPGFLNGFQLRVEPNLEGGDDTATNNARFFCSNLSNGDFVEGDGMYWGNWGEVKHCYSDQAFCGLQTQVEPYLDGGDDTSLNNIMVECCDNAVEPNSIATQPRRPEVKPEVPTLYAMNPKFVKAEHTPPRSSAQEQEKVPAIVFSNPKLAKLDQA